jgi:hypothetical protein
MIGQKLALELEPLIAGKAKKSKLNQEERFRRNLQNRPLILALNSPRLPVYHMTQ